MSGRVQSSRPQVNHPKEAGLSVHALRQKARWLRDDLEPNVARHGPKMLSPDVVLELASFFSRLLTHTSAAAVSPTIAAYDRQTNAPTNHQVSLDDLRRSRIHRAVLVVTGRGTRWPGGLVEICDSLVSAWTEKFGRLEAIRPFLYEAGGRLHDFKGERDLSRHALLVKWLSDPSTLVSPLQALEHGHLGVASGSWWIHPIFAFHAGMIDSPDPHGGIVADIDGCYAILLTGDDETSSESAEVFTYRARKRDKGVHRLMQAILPPKQPIRILRSHTLRSTWSPVAGVRYEGLYRVTKYSLSLDRDQRTRRFDITLQRDASTDKSDLFQLPMRQVRRVPNAEDVDDYIEYKRLREFRQQKRNSRRPPKHDQLLGVVPALRDMDAEEEDEDSDTASALGSLRLSTEHNGPQTEPEAPKDDQSPQGIPSSFDGTDRYGVDYDEGFEMPLERVSSDIYSPVEEFAPQFPAQKTGDIIECSDPSAHERIGEQLDGNSMQDQTSGEAASRQPSRPVRVCSSTDFQEDCLAGQGVESRKDSARGLSTSEGSHAMFSNQLHSSIHKLHTNIHALARAISHRGSMSQRFYEDLQGMLGVFERWAKDSVAKDGVVDQCLVALIKDVEAMRRAEPVEWQSREMEDWETMRALGGLPEHRDAWVRSGASRERSSSWQTFA